MKQKQMNKKIILNERSVNLFKKNGKKLLLHDNIELRRMETVFSLIPVEIDEDGYVFVPPEAVDMWEYSIMSKFLRTYNEYLELARSVREGGASLFVKTPILDSVPEIIDD